MSRGSDLPGQQTPLNVWRAVRERRFLLRRHALAAGVARRHREAADWKVADGKRSRARWRPATSRSCAESNTACLSVADVLAQVRLKVAIKRGGLFGTLGMPDSPWPPFGGASTSGTALRSPRWRTCSATARASPRGSRPASKRTARRQDGGHGPDRRRPSESVADDGRHKTPLEFLDAVLGRGGVSKQSCDGATSKIASSTSKLSGAGRRLRGGAASRRAPATVVRPLLRGWPIRRPSDPPSRAKDAVTVLTYHGSKGLEWPLVILTDLDSEPKGDAFGSQVASDVPWNSHRLARPASQALDALLALAARRAGKDNVGFDARRPPIPPRGGRLRGPNAPNGLRLLYVGATRARDYLVLAAKKDVTKRPIGSKSEWRRIVADRGWPVMAVPATTSPRFASRRRPCGQGLRISARPTTASRRHRTVAFAGAEVAADDRIFRFACVPATPSATTRRHRRGSRSRLATAVRRRGGHDARRRSRPSLSRGGRTFAWALAWRVALAQRLFAAWGVPGFDPRDVVDDGDRFREFRRQALAVRDASARGADRLPDRRPDDDRPTRRRRRDGRRNRHHRPQELPGGRAQWLDQARKYAGQLRIYGEAILASLPGPKPVQLALHLPIAGEVLMVE